MRAIIVSISHIDQGVETRQKSFTQHAFDLLGFRIKLFQFLPSQIDVLTQIRDLLRQISTLHFVPTYFKNSFEDLKLYFSGTNFYQFFTIKEAHVKKKLGGDFSSISVQYLILIWQYQVISVRNYFQETFPEKSACGIRVQVYCH